MPETDNARIDEIRRRLQAVIGDKPRPWTYEPKHEMFMGTTHAIKMYDRVIDLGRGHHEFIPVRKGEQADKHGYVLSAASQQEDAEIDALGKFMEQCREDMEFLLKLIESK